MEGRAKRVYPCVFASGVKYDLLHYFGLGLFPSDSLQSQSYEFIEIAHIGPYYGVENDCRNFRSNRMDSFRENRKKSKSGCFLAIFGLILAMFLTFQSCDLDAIAHIGY